MRQFLGLALLMELAIAPAAAQVRTFVSTSGVDNAECSRVSPCRTFSAAQTAVDAGGEILALDSGGYGPFIINKSVAVIAPPEVHAAIAPVSGVAIDITAAASDEIILRGLYLNSQGAVQGVRFFTGTDLYVESMVVSGFTEGIVANRMTFARMFIKNTMVRGCSGPGVMADPAVATMYVSISESRFFDNQQGVQIFADTRAVITRSVMARSTNGGLFVGGVDSEVNLDECVIANNNTGIMNFSGTIRINNTVLFNNTNVAIFNNGGTVETRQNNLAAHNSSTEIIVGNPLVPIAGN